MKVYCTKEVSLTIKQKAGFRGFVNNSLDRFFSGDFGECKDQEQNTDNDKLGVYSTENNDFKIWIKQDYDIVTVLFPSEW